MKTIVVLLTFFLLAYFFFGFFAGCGWRAGHFQTGYYCQHLPTTNGQRLLLSMKAGCYVEEWLDQPL